jgi:hypothetical protein
MRIGVGTMNSASASELTCRHSCCTTGGRGATPLHLVGADAQAQPCGAILGVERVGCRARRGSRTSSMARGGIPTSEGRRQEGRWSRGEATKRRVKYPRWFPSAGALFIARATPDMVLSLPRKKKNGYGFIPRVPQFYRTRIFSGPLELRASSLTLY